MLYFFCFHSSIIFFLLFCILSPSVLPLRILSSTLSSKPNFKVFSFFFSFYQAFNSQGLFVHSLRSPVTCHRALVSRLLSQYTIHLPMQETQETLVQSLGQKDSPGGGYGYPLQYSCLGSPMDRGAWKAAVHGVAKNGTRLSTQHVFLKN